MTAPAGLDLAEIPERIQSEVQRVTVDQQAARCSRVSASRPRHCCTTMFATSPARPTTSSCSGTMWRRSGPRWKPMRCPGRYSADQ